MSTSDKGTDERSSVGESDQAGSATQTAPPQLPETDEESMHSLAEPAASVTLGHAAALPDVSQPDRPGHNPTPLPVESGTDRDWSLAEHQMTVCMDRVCNSLHLPSRCDLRCVQPRHRDVCVVWSAQVHATANGSG